MTAIRMMGATLVAAMLAGCADVPQPTPPAGHAALDSGIHTTGSAGPQGGSAAPPAGAGRVTTYAQ